MVVSRPGVIFLLYVVVVVLVAENHGLNPHQQFTKNDFQAEDVEISLLITQAAVLRLLNDSCTTSSWHEKELEEMRNLRLVLDVKTRDLLNLQNLTEASLQEINTKTEEVQNLTEAALQELNTKKEEWQSINSASLQEMNTRKEELQSITSAFLQEMNTKKEEWQSMASASLQEMNTKKEELQSITSASLQEMNTKKEELQSMASASLQEMNTKKEELQSITSASLQEMNTKKEELQSMASASLQEMNTKKEELQSMASASLQEMNTKKEELQSMASASLQEINTKKEELQSMASASLQEMNTKKEELQSMASASLNEIKIKTEEARQEVQKAAFKAAVEQGLYGWRKYQSTHYKLFDGSGNYTQDTKACKALGGYLASIGSEGENSFLVDMAEDHTYIGLSDEEEEGVFVWQDGSPFIYSKWRSNEPNDSGGKEDCVEIFNKAPTWNDVPCDRDYHYICEVSFQ